MAAGKPVPTEMELDPKYDHLDFPAISIEEREGHAGFLNAGQQAQIHQLRMMLESEDYKGPLDSLTLLRFLRARKFDVAAAKKMLQDSQQWRDAMTIFDIATSKQRLLSKDKIDPVLNPPPVPLKLTDEVRTWDGDGEFKRNLSGIYTQFYHKTDKDGRPLYIEKLGGIDFDKLKEAKQKYTSDRMVLNLAVEYEKMVDPRLPACSRKVGRLVETSCTIIDAQGLGVWGSRNIGNYVRQTSAMSGNNYPERMGKMFVINVSWAQRRLWPVIKAFLDPVTASKIQVWDEAEAKANLPKHIPIENLPKSLYGTCECEGGCELSDAGPWQNEQWRRPAWWEKDPEETTIENKPAEVEAGNGAPIAADTQIEGQATEAEVAGATSTDAPVTEEPKVPA